MEAQNKLETWAIVELMGHAREIGFVTTEYFGPACLFRVDVPALPEREFVLTRPEAVNEENGNAQWAPAGSKVKRAAVPGRSPLLGVASIYKLTPCTEATAMAAIEEFAPRKLTLLELAKETPRLPNSGDDDCPGCDDPTATAQHKPGCEFAYRS